MMQLRATAYVLSVVALAAFPTPSTVFAASQTDDDELIVSNSAPPAFLPNHLHSADKSTRLKFDTDDCGVLRRVTNTHSMLVATALDDWDDSDDPSIEGEALIGKWLSAHPEIAVVVDGLDKWCGDVSPMDEDLPPVPARWSQFAAHRQVAWMPPRTSSIA